MARGRPSKKAHIVEVACELFTKQGYQSTSIDQVVVAAVVSKPTVYSNFPTKLVLWETVLSSLTDRAKEEMDAVLLKQKAATQPNLITGWIALWSAWVGKQERLAVYRILLGEQHKMVMSTTELFDQFEAVLESALLEWLTAFDVSAMHLFALKAVSKEAMLTPALLNQPLMKRDELERQLEWVALAEAHLPRL
ncbi:TetR/AcrR family transcriptional regulator [Marinomonas transparens]|uniref:TetR/AcrR family transcriptional regulator n=1 Tax=Marinomonas transparens TaxID=2795388 RepID=A0A934N1U0_9GAMM|nr:TetR/AcrR family transcriptional regulator [Marinomonas transparens]MBJ7539845.1 TetR/AcrR family transcriptional regulator [Marinomonas transparens]